MAESPSFIHLKVHSEYSLVDGLVRVPSLIDKAVELNQPAIALTDLTNFYALIKFYSAAITNGVKPICGCDLLVLGDKGEESASSLTLLVKNNEGYQNLIKIISNSYQEGQSRGKAYTQVQWIEQHSAGLIALSGAKEGSIGQALLNEDLDLAKAELQRWMNVFPDSFYLEIQRTERPREEAYIHAAIELSAEFSCPVVATNDVRFLTAEEFEAHEARVCINDRRTLEDPRRPRTYSDTQFLRSSEEMLDLFADIPEALENTVEIAKRCNIELSLGTPCLPDYPVPKDLGVDAFLRQLSEDGLKQRLLDLDEVITDEKRRFYQERLDFELDIITQMGFPGYFLIVMEFIQWAKDNGVPVGPGRGSGAGSLVAYSLKITDLDPLEYDLLFERFLNPERISMPDFDVDFCMDGRDRVIEHVAELYGRDAVSQIITFGTMAAKGVIRDVARVQGKSYALADKLSKLVPFEIGMTLEKAMQEEPQLASFVANDEEADEIMEMAFKLEGVVRNVGKHAGGVVIAPGKLTDFTPLYCDETGSNLVTQYDMSDVEKAGLVKFDFLGLRTLTIINGAVSMINTEQAASQKEGLAQIDISHIPLNDPAVYQLLINGETTAVFQLESKGMKELIKRLKPNTFEDIVALVALYRPGPLGSGMVDDFINRKHGAEVAYPHPLVEPILKNTYGVILYQEQVMQIAQVLANYSLGGADMLRRAMGKKKPEEMQKQSEIFLAGAAKNNIDPKQAEIIFDLMEKFAGYGFNKSHSAAYALVSYQTAWLKTHYPAHFMASVLSADMQNTDKIVVLADECRHMQLSLRAPNVNIGSYGFTVDYNDKGDAYVVYGLGAIKGLGEGPIENIIETREASGPFRNLFDFCKRVDLSIINKRSLEALIRSGAFDSISKGVDRAILIASMSEAIKTAAQAARIQESGVDDLFGELVPTEESTDDVYENYRHIRPWSEQRRLHEEKESLGLYLSGHPIEEYLPEVARITNNRIVNLRPNNAAQTVIGLVYDMRVIKSKRGDNIAILTLDDQSGRIEVSLFGEVYESVRETLSKDEIVYVEGVVSQNEYAGDGSFQIRAKSISSFQKAREAYLRHITLNFQQESLCTESLEELELILEDYIYTDQSTQHPQPAQQATLDTEKVCSVVVNYAREGVQGKIAFGKSWRVKPDDELLHRLKEHYGEQGVSLSY